MNKKNCRLSQGKKNQQVKMKHAADNNLFSLIEPSTPSAFYSNTDGGLSLTNTIDEDDCAPRSSYNHTREDIISGITPRTRRREKKSSFCTRSAGKKRTSSIPYGSIGARSSGESRNKRKKRSVGSIIASILDPEALELDHNIECCESYLEKCRKHLPNLLSEADYNEMKENIKTESRQKYIDFIKDLNASLSVNEKAELSSLLSEDHIVNESDEREYEEETLGVGEGLQPDQMIHVIPELSTPKMRKNIPRQDGKPGPSDDPEDHWGNEVLENITKRKKIAEKDVVANFIRLVSGRMATVMNELVDNSDQVQISKDLEAQLRAQRAQLDALSKRLRSLLSMYERATEQEIEVRTTQATIGEKTEVGQQAQEIMEEYVKLNPAETTISDVLLLEDLRNVGKSFYQLYKDIFESLQKKSGFGTPEDAVINLKVANGWTDTILEEMILRNLMQSSEGGLRTPASVQLQGQSLDYGDLPITIPEYLDAYEIQREDILNKYRVFAIKLINTTFKALRYLSETVEDYEFASNLADFVSAYAEDAKLILTDIARGTNPDTSNLKSYIKYMKISIYLVFTVFIREAEGSIKTYFKGIGIDTKWFEAALETFFQEVTQANNAPSGEAILEIPEKTGIQILFGPDEQEDTTTKRSPLGVYNKLTKASKSYVSVVEEFDIPSKTFENRIISLLERTIDLFESVGMTNIDADNRSLQEKKDIPNKEERIRALYNFFLKIQPKLISVMELVPSEQEKRTLGRSVIDIRNRLDIIRRSISSVIREIATIRPQYRHTAAHALQIENSGIVVPTASLQFANAKAFSILEEYLPDVAKAGLERLQSDKEVVTSYVDLVSSIILESRTDFGRQWTQKEKMNKAVLLKANGFESLAKHTWTGKNWIYGDDILARRRSMPTGRKGIPSLPYPVPMFTYVKQRGPGFY